MSPNQSSLKSFSPSIFFKACNRNPGTHVKKCCKDSHLSKDYISESPNVLQWWQLYQMTPMKSWTCKPVLTIRLLTFGPKTVALLQATHCFLQGVGADFRPLCPFTFSLASPHDLCSSNSFISPGLSTASQPLPLSRVPAAATDMASPYCPHTGLTYSETHLVVEKKKERDGHSSGKQLAC